MAKSPIYLVRHGRNSGENLTDEGRTKDAVRARDALIASGAGRGALLLSSALPRALQTAEIIAGGICGTVVPSKRMKEGASWVAGIRNLDTFIDKALEEERITMREGRGLIVVTHAPVLAVAKGMYEPDAATKIGYGEVVEYVPGTWHNPAFSEVEERIIERQLTI